LKNLKQKGIEDMKTKFEKEVNKILKRGRKELKKTGTIKSKAYIFGDNRKANVIPLFFSDHPIDKRLEIDRIRNIAREGKAKCVVLLSDAFMGQSNGIRPSLDPDRKEAICLIGEDEKGKFAVYQEYARNFNNKIKLGEITTGRNDGFEGLMIEEPFGVCSSD
jgi:hypothetical protein